MGIRCSPREQSSITDPNIISIRRNSPARADPVGPPSAAPVTTNMTVVNPTVVTTADNQIPSDIPAYDCIPSHVSPNVRISRNPASAPIEMTGCADPRVEISAMCAIHAAVKAAAAAKATAPPGVRLGKKGHKSDEGGKEKN